VIVGDLTDFSTIAKIDSSSNDFDNGFVLLIHGTRQPIPNQKYRLTTSSGQILTGTTDASGRTVRISAKQAESITVDFIED